MLIVAIAALAAAVFLIERYLGTELPAKTNEAATIALDASIGATVEPLDDDTAKSLGIPRQHWGLVITSLGGNGPAGRAGIKAGDVVERIDGIPVSSPAGAAAALKRTPASDPILLINRHGEYGIVRLPIRARPQHSTWQSKEASDDQEDSGGRGRRHHERLYRQGLG